MFSLSAPIKRGGSTGAAAGSNSAKACLIHSATCGGYANLTNAYLRLTSQLPDGTKVNANGAGHRRGFIALLPFRMRR